MNAFFTGLFSELKSSSAATKSVIVLAIVAIVGVIGFAVNVANAPHFKLLYSDQDARHAAAIQGALASGNIRFEVSQPPAPFVIHVDENQYYQAQNLVALSGALDSAPEGIQSGASGASQVFLSAPERAQNVLKREWQELEKQLEELDFVMRAHVSTSTPDGSVLRKSGPMTVAVTLLLRGGTELQKSQAQTVAKLVRYRFNVPSENVVISDQSGRSLFDGTASSELSGATADLFDHKARYDSDLTARTNEVLDRIFGAGMAYVLVNSDWTYEETESVKEILDPKNKVDISKTESKSTTPPGASTSAGGPVGATGNLTAEFGSTNAAIGSGGSGGNATTSGASATTSETKTASIVGKETEHRRSATPDLKRLTVSLFLDESLKDKLADPARLAALESSVKNAIGFDEKRDAFSSILTPFASIPRDESGKLVPPTAKPALEERSPMVEMLIQRSVEVISALAFIFVLLKALKSAPAKKKKGEIDGAAPVEDAVDENDPRYLEMLARSQIEELVKSEPEKVGTILSRWVAEEETLARS